MGPFNWQCRLYGHDWRHPWTHEVVVTAENDSVYPVRCDRCTDTRLLDRNGNSWRLEDGDGPSVHEHALESEPSQR
ncbi:hypothetical protein [Natronorubrum sulfidifaciens]|uniref:Uncharacterized protein n=1 Tax=Natronorubrum sulfidifaciens JCM 14089 TaxID=1230460 RepID=L9W5R5_9EURY|nr:hypothetical protein [Natronorubrum sulfidifaciens]ELY44611.1 hypothetical protein C495_11939 [Natronorubrum sulfidifaciens JCM 14089]